MAKQGPPEDRPALANLKDEPGYAKIEALRALYLPYCWGVVIPWFAASTVGMGAAAFVLAKLSPNAAFHLGTVWSWLVLRINWNRIKVHGREHIVDGQSYVIMSNHQSQFDILAFYGSWYKQFRWVMKEELRKTPGIGWYCDAGGHVFIDRSNREKAIASLNAAKPLLDGGISVMFFPEGTRSRDGRLKPFKKGAFMMARDMELPILPVSISGTRKILRPGTFRCMPGRADITIHPPVQPADYGEDVPALMHDVREQIRSALSDWERGDD